MRKYLITILLSLAVAVTTAKLTTCREPKLTLEGNSEWLKQYLRERNDEEFVMKKF